MLGDVFDVYASLCSAVGFGCFTAGCEGAGVLLLGVYCWFPLILALTIARARAHAELRFLLILHVMYHACCLLLYVDMSKRSRQPPAIIPAACTASDVEDKRSRSLLADPAVPLGGFVSDEVVDGLVSPVDLVAMPQTFPQRDGSVMVGVDMYDTEDSGKDAASPCPAVRASAPPVSPGNRDKFMAGLHVQMVGCNVDNIVAGPSVRLTFRGTVVVVYPPSTSPERRYVMFMDSNGCAGITVWNANVAKFNYDAIGKLVQITKMIVTVHQAKRSLTMSKESSVQFVEGANPWWSSLLADPVISIMDIFRVPDHSIINVCGIVGSISVEEKSVRAEKADLVILRLVDRTGQIELRSWNAKLSDFSRFREKPTMFQRVRVTAYAGSKMLEMITGSGTLIGEDFEGAADLAKFWKE